MGSKVSGLYRKVWDGIGWESYGEENNTINPTERNLLNLREPNIFILKRVSSMFFNEDGDLAHEFYEEVKSRKKKRSKMKKVNPSSLIPQGEVDLRYPKIHPDIPVIMCEV